MIPLTDIVPSSESAWKHGNMRTRELPLMSAIAITSKLIVNEKRGDGCCSPVGLWRVFVV